jgi:DNA-binding MarR family transcriptional regulator
MSDDEKKKVIKELVSFYEVFQKEILDKFPDDMIGIAPLLSKALREIYLTENITSSVLAKRLSITEPNTSRCLHQLSVLGYIIRVKDVEDRRITHIKLTEKGMQIVDKSLRSMDELMLKKLGVLELDELVRLSNSFSTIKELFEKVGTTKL